MDFDPAAVMERMVALLEGHPLAFIGCLVAILLIMGFQKDGLFSQIFGYLQAKANHEAALEQRRMKIILMIENRAQREIPGLEEPEERR